MTLHLHACGIRNPYLRPGCQNVIYDSENSRLFAAQLTVHSVQPLDFLRGGPEFVPMSSRSILRLHDEFTNIQLRIRADGMKHPNQAVIVQRISFCLRWRYGYERVSIEVIAPERCSKRGQHSLELHVPCRAIPEHHDDPSIS